MRRAAMRVGIRDIAEASGMSYRSTLAAEKRGEFKYGDLWSIARWLIDRARRNHDRDHEEQR